MSKSGPALKEAKRVGVWTFGLLTSLVATLALVALVRRAVDIRSLVAEAIDFLIVDTVHLVSGMKRLPRGGFIGIQRGFRRDAVTNEGQRIGFVAEHAG